MKGMLGNRRTGPQGSGVWTSPAVLGSLAADTNTGENDGRGA